MNPSDLRADLPGPDEIALLVAELRGSSGEFAALLSRHGRAAPALRHFGLVRWQDADLAGATTALRAALGSTPDDPDLWRDLAGVLDARGEAAAAEAAVRMALRFRPEDARAWLTLAQLRSRVDDRHEAVECFGRALLIDPTLGDAHLGLGLIAFARKELAPASASLRSAIANGHATTLGYSALAHVLYVSGHFADSADAFDRAADLGSLDVKSSRQRTRARTFATIVAGGLDRVVAEHAEADPAGLDTLLRDAYAALSGYGYRDAAEQVGRLRLARNPDDPEQRYLLDALAGRELARAPADYVERHFDEFASSFDGKLVDVLHYDVPRTLARLVAGAATRFGDVLDLGCGTGLAAGHLASFGGRLTGVDLSGRMLDEAAKRGLYADLVKADAIAYLGGRSAAFDLIAAADVLNYFGDLAPLFAGVRRALRPGGLFAFSVETMAEGSHRLQASGRFTHAVGSVERLAVAAGLSVVAREATVLRIEAGRPSHGQVILLRREPTRADA